MKKSPTTQFFTIAAALLFAASTSSAANLTWSGGNNADNNWSATSSWSNGPLPTSSDSVLINQNRRAFVNSDVNFGGSLTLANGTNTNHTAVVDVRTGGIFAVSTASVGKAGGSHGRIDVTGGDMTTTGPVMNRDTINLSSGTLSLFNTATGGNNWALEVDTNSINNTAGGVLNVTGGALTAGAAMTSGTIQFYSAIDISAGSFTTVAQTFFSGTSLTINGDAATIALTQLNQTVGRAVDLNFNFGSAGVSTITSAGFVNLAGATINVVGSAYAGGAGVFTLISSTNYVDGVFAGQSVTGFAGLNGVVSASGNDLILTLTELPYATELATVAALGTDAAMLTAPVMYADDTTMITVTVSAGERKAVYFAGLNYLGNPTRIYAWVGIPAGADTTPVPGMVLVHGGGGTAHESWVEKWNERGFAAISIAVEGQTDDNITPPLMNTGWHIHDKPGPVRAGMYNDTNVSPITDQWMYHAVADTVLANSLLRSLPEVVDSDVGLSGYSWGGVITSTVIGIDNRFKFAIPTYGCGHLFDARNAYGANLGGDELYEQVWDPMVRIANATMPVLWFSWPEDKHFPMDSFAYTYHAAPGTRMVSLKPAMGHGGNFNSPETYDFAASIISGGPWCVQQSLNLVGNTATVVFDATKILNSASLVYRSSNQPIISNLATEAPNPWTEIAADSLVESPVGTWTATATLPAGVTGWFVNVKATGSDAVLYGYNDANITASSDYQEIIDLSLSPSTSLALEHLLADNQSTDTVSVSYSGPANVEISSITISGESHAGAFSSLTAAPLVLLTPTPDTTPVTIQFDNTVAGLTAGQTATATLTITWDELDGSTDQVTLPLSATARTPLSVVYSSTSDWTSETVDSIDDVTINNGATVTLDQNASVGSLTVNDATSPTTGTLLIDQNFNLTIGGTLALGGGTGAGIVNQSTGTVTTADLAINDSGTGDTSQYNLSGGELSVSSVISINANGELNQTGGTISGSGTIANNGSFSYDSTTNQTLSGVISGAGSVTKDGTGTLTLSASNTYTGGTTVNAGLLDLVGQNRIDGALTVDGTGIVKLSGTSHNAFGGISSVTLQNGGTFTDNSLGGLVQSVSAPVTFTNGGTMTSEAGANGTGGFGNYLFINGINVTGTGLATISASGISFNNGQTITVADTVAGSGTDLLIASIIKNDRVGTNIKAGAGTLTLTGINTDTSPWSITAGTLEIGGAGQLEGGSYAEAISNNGVFAYNSTADQTLSGVISSTGSVTKDGTGTLTISNHGTYSGATTILDGTLKLSGSQKRNLATTYTVDGASAVLEAANIQVFSAFGSSYDKELTATNGGTIKATSVAIRIGDVTLQNGSRLTANGSDGTYGGCYIGQLAGGASPTVTVTGSGASQIDGTGNMTLVSTIFEVEDVTGNNAADLTVSLSLQNMTGISFTGNVQIDGAVTKTGAGTLTLSATNSYTGATTVSAGILSLGNGTNNTALNDAADMIVASGAMLNLNYTGTDTIDELSLGGALQTPGIWGASGSGATFINDSFFSGGGTLTVGTGPEPTAYQSWGVDNGLSDADALTTANPESDGLSNLLEFAFGTDPTVSNGSSIAYGSGVTPGLPLLVLETITSNNVDSRAVFARRKEWVAAGLTYTVQFSADLSEWVDSSETPTLLESGSGDIDAVYVDYPLIIQTTAGFEKAQFFRLSVSHD